MDEEATYNNVYPDQQNWDLNSDFDQIQEQQPLNILTLPHSERGIAGFVSKLYQCLQSNDGRPKYVRWCRHNEKDMFVIDCIPEFTKVVLPRLFKHCKFPSFVRQLNIYGFQRDTDARKSKDTRDKESCRWYHPYFRPNRRDLFHLIRRKAIRYSRKKTIKSPIEEDPDTILNISGDEEEEETNTENILFVNNNENELSSSPVSSVIQHAEYNKDTKLSSLAHENEPEDSPIITQNSHIFLENDSHQPSHVLSDNGDSHHHPILSENEQGNSTPYQQENSIFSENKAYQQETHIFSENDAQSTHILPENEAVQSSFMPPDETETYNLYMDHTLIHNDPFVRIQHLEIQLHQLKMKYSKTEDFLKKELHNAHIHINQQQRRIQELEYALGITKSVKQETQAGGYIDTMTNSLMHGNYLPIHAPNVNQLYSQQNAPLPDQQWLYPPQQNDHVFKYM